MKSGIDEMRRASETAMMFAPHNVAFADRQQFVRNLGWLMAQTREGIIGCELGEDEVVTITFRGERTSRVNVNADSYMAIIRDVTRNYDY